MKLRALYESEWGWKQRRLATPTARKPYQRPERDPLDSRATPFKQGRDVSQELLDKQRDLNAARETQKLPQVKPKSRASAEGARLWLNKKQQKQQDLGPEFDWQPRKPKPKPVSKKNRNLKRGRETKQRQQDKWKQNPYY